MIHRRTKIRRKIRDILMNKTRAGARVYTSQSVPIDDKELPVVLIYGLSENATEYAVAPRELKRVLEIRIECVASGAEVPFEEGKETLEDILDEMSADVEKALSIDDTVGCTADDIVLTSTEIQFEGDGARPIGAARLTYDVTYHQMVPESSSLQAGIEDHKTSSIDWHVGHDNDEPDLTSIEAQDEVEMP